MPTVDFTWLFLKMMVVLVVVCVAALLILKYAVPRSRFLGRWAKPGVIKLLGRAALGGHRDVWIIRVGRRHFLIGAGTSAVSLLAELSEQDLKEGVDA